MTPNWTTCVECRRRIRFGWMCALPLCRKANAPVSYRGKDVTPDFSGTVDIHGNFTPFDESKP